MKRAIPFMRLRYVGFTLSAVLLVGGLVGTILRGGFNIGIDFQAGLSEQIRIAPVAFSIAYAPSDPTATMSLNMTGSSLSLTEESPNGTQTFAFPYATYPTIGAVESALSAVPGVTVTGVSAADQPSANLVGIGSTLTLSATPATINVGAVGSAASASIEQVRASLASLGSPLVQTVGAPGDQQFLVRVEDKARQPNFQAAMTQRVKELLGSTFGADNVIVEQSQYIGAQFSQNLAQQAFTLTILALLLIMVYIWIRFRLSYAIAAMLSTIHDPLVMIGFIGVFQLEVNTATIAAVLTIVGYSLNDTVVVFDRIRENRGLMRESPLALIIDTSITQVLHRTIITSLTVLLAVVAILVETTGSIQEFALNMVVGVVVGTYSSIFIASQVLLIWDSARERRRRRIEAIKYGTHEILAKAAAQGGGESAEAGNGSSATVAASGSPKTVEVIIPHIERKLHGKRRRRK